MGDEPILRGNEGEKYPEAAELLVETESEGSGRRWLVAVIIIILLLLLLFWPIKPDVLKQERARERRERALAEKKNPAGAAEYRIISGKPMKELLPKTRKGTAVGVWFYVRNLSSQGQVLDYSMVTLKDQFGMEYAVLPDLTEKVYQREKMSSPWGERLAPRERIKALAVFSTFAGPRKAYALVGHDFEWTSQKTKEYEIGIFDTFPGRMYGPPDKL